MIVAITGATGFIGSSLLESHILKGDTVRVLTRDKRKIRLHKEKIEIFQGGINDINLKSFVQGVDVLYHCAAEITDESKMWKVNYSGTKRLFTAALGSVKRWVQLSSVGVYGAPEFEIITENCAENPSGSYESSKAAADRLIRSLSVGSAIEVVILRPTNVYGVTMGNQSLFQMISVIDKGLFFYIGKGSFVSHYIHVSDVVKALLLCGSKANAAGKVYNLSCDESIKDLVNAISSALCKSPPKRKMPEKLINMFVYLFGATPNFPLSKGRVKALTSTVRYSSDFIKKDLGFRCQTPLSDGVQELVSEWKKNK